VAGHGAALRAAPVVDADPAREPHHRVYLLTLAKNPCNDLCEGSLREVCERER
jgi:hypothetical protein